uniref:Macrophage-capping protein n=1 Tax=Electrophorus electricus TaxID=8005 RepID=A0A4W4FJ05_ELEEL
MVVHNEFTTAGKEPGLKIWRIEHMDLKPVPKNLYGNFYTGDAYLLLYTTSLPSYNIHMWLGEECSQDESGACAILCTQLDNYLGGYPVQYREVQCNESLTFQGYFKSGIKYQKGGIASGFRHVVTNDANVKYVLHVKGRRTIRATEVEFSWASFNQGDCFIIDLGKDIYQWHGKQCNMFEKTQALNMSRKIRDGERNGRATVHVVEEGEEPQALIDALGPKTAISPPIPDSDTVETANKNKAALYMISDASGSMKTACVAQSNPFKQEMLIPEECFILDNGVDNNVFVWKGPKANEAERKAAMTAAQEFIKEKNYSNKTQIQVLPAGGETTLFKQFFKNWMDKDQTKGPTKPFTIGRIAHVQQIPFDASTLHSNHAMAAQHKMVDDGSGKIQIWRVEEGARVPVEPASYGQFYGGDCYIILYTYKQGSREQHIIYTCEEEVATSKHVVTFLGGSPVDVVEGKEPGVELCTFPLKISTRTSTFWTALGGKKEYQSSKSLQKMIKAPRLFGCSNKTGRLVVEEVPGDFGQVDLATDDVMLLDVGDQIFLWVGSQANEVEKTGAPKIAKEYVDTDPSGRSGIPITTIKQGAEPPIFTGWFHAWDVCMWEKSPLENI